MHYQCAFEGCHRVARDGLTDQGRRYCGKHGGGRRCQWEGCNKVGIVCHSVVKNPKTDIPFEYLCIAHGGGRRCAVPGCTRAKQGGKEEDGYRCYVHGGNRLTCLVETCQKLVRKKNTYCKKHTPQGEAATFPSVAPRKRHVPRPVPAGYRAGQFEDAAEAFEDYQGRSPVTPGVAAGLLRPRLGALDLHHPPHDAASSARAAFPESPGSGRMPDHYPLGPAGGRKKPRCEDPAEAPSPSSFASYADLLGQHREAPQQLLNLRQQLFSQRALLSNVGASLAKQYAPPVVRPHVAASRPARVGGTGAKAGELREELDLERALGDQSAVFSQLDAALRSLESRSREELPPVGARVRWALKLLTLGTKPVGQVELREANSCAEQLLCLMGNDTRMELEHQIGKLL